MIFDYGSVSIKIGGVDFAPCATDWDASLSAWYPVAKVNADSRRFWWKRAHEVIKQMRRAPHPNKVMRHWAKQRRMGA